MAALDDGWADPRRLHREGRNARLLLDGAREALAAAFGFRTEEVALTGSFTTAVQAGVLGALLGRRRVGSTFVHSEVEHSSVFACGSWHAEHGDPAAPNSTELIGVDRTGAVDAGEFCAAVSPQTPVAALQWANGEVGTCQPVAEVAATCREAGVPLFVDGSAAAGTLDLSGSRAVADLLALDPSWWGAPAGLGVLCTRAGVRWRSPWPADGDGPAHSPAAPGQVSIPVALSAAVGLQAVLADRAAADQRRREATARLRERLPALVRDCEVVGAAERRLPQILTFSVLFADGEALVTALDRAGFAVGSGSACTSSTLRPSHVLAAMGVLTHGNVRLVLPTTTPAAELAAQLAEFERVLPHVVTTIRASLGTSEL